MYIIITGCAGFIGSNLLDHFLKNGHKVYGIDNLSTGNVLNLLDASKNKKFTFYKCDLLKFLKIKKSNKIDNASPERKR